MRIALDFDGTLVYQDRPYDDLDTPLRWLPEAKEGVIDLILAQHAHNPRRARPNDLLRLAFSD